VVVLRERIRELEAVRAATRRHAQRRRAAK